MDPLALKVFAQKFGTKKTELYLAELGRNTGLVQVLQTSIGHELLSDWASEWAAIFAKVVRNDATDEEKMQFRLLDAQLSKMAQRIGKYYQLEMAIEDAGKE